MFPYLDTVHDAEVLTVELHVHVEPGVPAAHLERVVEDVAEPVVDHVTQLHVNVLGPELKRKFMSCTHCQEWGQQASWLLIGYTRVNNQSEAR